MYIYSVFLNPIPLLYYHLQSCLDHLRWAFYPFGSWSVRPPSLVLLILMLRLWGVFRVLRWPCQFWYTLWRVYLQLYFMLLLRDSFKHPKNFQIYIYFSWYWYWCCGSIGFLPISLHFPIAIFTVDFIDSSLPPFLSIGLSSYLSVNRFYFYISLGLWIGFM